MPHGQPSRRSFFAWLGAAFASLFAARNAPASPLPPAPPCPPSLPCCPHPAGWAIKTFTYDGTGGLLPYCDHGGHVTTLVYDGRGTSAARPGPLQGHSSYPAAHGPAARRCPGGESYRVVVEGGKRLVRVTTTDASGKVVKSEDFPF